MGKYSAVHQRVGQWRASVLNFKQKSVGRTPPRSMTQCRAFDPLNDRIETRECAVAGLAFKWNRTS